MRQLHFFCLKGFEKIEGSGSKFSTGHVCGILTWISDWQTHSQPNACALIQHCAHSFCHCVEKKVKHFSRLVVHYEVPLFEENTQTQCFGSSCLVSHQCLNVVSGVVKSLTLSATNPETERVTVGETTSASPKAFVRRSQNSDGWMERDGVVRAVTVPSRRGGKPFPPTRHCHCALKGGIGRRRLSPTPITYNT